jgi:F-type H+-transporting ATPase subunit b
MNRFALLISLTILALATSLSFAAAPDAAHAADTAHAVGDDAHGDSHGGGHEANPLASVKEGFWTGVTAIVLFVIVFALLSTMVWPKIVSGLDERNEKIVGEIAAAEAARKQAKEALNEYEKNLAEARAESQKMLEETRAQQGQLAAQLKANADAELGAMREKALAEIEAAKKQALGEIYNESVNIATVMAGKILQRQVTVEDQQRLMDESIAEMKSVS